MEINYEILNYLNLVDERFGDNYLKNDFNPLPSDFKLTDDLIVERINFKSIEQEANIPDFVYETKKEIKKRYKNSLNNTKRIEEFLIKNQGVNLTISMRDKMLQYVAFRKLFLKEELKKFKNTSFDEKESIKELISIDPIFAELFEETFFKYVNNNIFVNKIGLEYIQAYELQKQKAKQKQQELQISMARLMEMSKEAKENASDKKQDSYEKLKKSSFTVEPKVAIKHTARTISRNSDNTSEEENTKC